MTKLQRLKLGYTHLSEKSVRSLLALPEMKDLTVYSSVIPPTLPEQLKTVRPGVRLDVRRQTPD